MNATAGPALQRILRVMSLGIGIAAVIFAAIKTPDALAQAPVYGIPWTLVGVAGFVLPVVVMVPLAFVAPMGVLRGLALLSAGGFVAACALTWVVLPERADPGVGNWPLTISALATSVVAIWWGRVVAGTYLAVAVGLLEAVRFTRLDGPDIGVTILDACYTLMFNLVFVALAIALRTIAVRVDDAASIAMADTRAVAAADAREHERMRVASLVHDQVLVTLLAASDPDPARRVGAATLAASALSTLTHPVTTDPVELSARDLTWRLQSVSTGLCPVATFSYELSTDATSVPGAAASALVEAAAEAMRNSVRHAGAGVDRAVHVHIDHRTAGVTVLDDGVGFVPDRIPPERLGIAVSIEARMRSITRGEAYVISTPGVGTRVVARWTRDE